MITSAGLRVAFLYLSLLLAIVGWARGDIVGFVLSLQFLLFEILIKDKPS